MTLALFSLAGIPPFAGFFSKFFIFAAAFESGFHLLVFIALINTILSLYYYLKIVKAMYCLLYTSDSCIGAAHPLVRHKEHDERTYAENGFDDTLYRLVMVHPAESVGCRTGNDGYKRMDDEQGKDVYKRQEQRNERG